MSTTTTPKRKLGRPFKAAPVKPRKQAVIPAPPAEAALDREPALLPPSISFRAFKIALSTLKERNTIPNRLDRSVWTNKLFGTNLHDTIEAYRFLGLIDAASEPAPEFAALLDALDTDAWSAELRKVLEKSYAPLLASSISALTAGGLLRTFRTIYRTPSETTRKCCNFFVHAAREATLDIGPFLLTNSRSRWVEGRRVDRWESTAPAGDIAGTSAADINAEAFRSLIAKFPTYDATWSDDVKRLWFGAFSELIRRLED
ncbi:MAG: hypothetical protein IPO30_22315 [Hyphomonadaceae bacterium]|nr:hypothetical protein [Hyphomonadaceae bacterium]